MYIGSERIIKINIKKYKIIYKFVKCMSKILRGFFILPFADL